jgi:ribosomal protein S18 acetylase RimI-like enzyme
MATTPGSGSRNSYHADMLQLRPESPTDRDFLYQLYVSTRLPEMALTGWNEHQVEAFLRMQFDLQHNQYLQNYPSASCDIISIDDTPAGRLYVDRSGDRILIIDISLLPEFKGKGVGGTFLRKLTDEADVRGIDMSLHVEVNNPIRTFYQSLGFRELEQRGMYYYMERATSRGGTNA